MKRCVHCAENKDSGTSQAAVRSICCRQLKIKWNIASNYLYWTNLLTLVKLKTAHYLAVSKDSEISNKEWKIVHGLLENNVTRPSGWTRDNNTNPLTLQIHQQYLSSRELGANIFLIIWYFCFPSRDLASKATQWMTKGGWENVSLVEDGASVNTDTCSVVMQ